MQEKMQCYQQIFKEFKTKIGDLLYRWRSKNQGPTRKLNNCREIRKKSCQKPEEKLHKK